MVVKVLFVTPDLEYNGANKQLALLAAYLPRERFSVRVCALGSAGPMAESFRAAGLEVETLEWTRLIEITPFLRLRKYIHGFAPTVIHTWRLSSLRTVLLIAGGKHKIIASAFQPPPKANLLWLSLDRRLVSRVDQVLATSVAEAHLLRGRGVPAGKIALIPPAAAAAPPTGAAHGALRQALGFREDARLLLCVGPLERRKGFRDAIWAYEILQYVYDNLHLVLVGEGPHRLELQQFAQACRGVEHIHFVGSTGDVPGWMAQADVIWVPSRKSGGVSVALEALAVGRPIVAGRLPGLTEILGESGAGLFFSPGDKVELARQTRLLLDNPARCRLMGEAGRKHAASSFAVSKFVENCIRLYEAD
jgi:glycosyltransferase involved in cell wall biosynthesis